MNPNPHLIALETAIGEDSDNFKPLLDEYIKAGHFLHAFGTNGLTLATRLAQHGSERLEQLNYLLSNLSVDEMLMPDKRENTMLDIAQKSNNTELLQILLNKLCQGAPQLVQFSKVRIQSLERAIDKNQTKDFKKLLDQYLREGQNINQIGSDGFTLLTRLVNAKEDSKENLQHLLSKMMAWDINTKDGKGRTASVIANQLPLDKKWRVQLIDKAVIEGMMRRRGILR